MFVHLKLMTKLKTPTLQPPCDGEAGAVFPPRHDGGLHPGLQAAHRAAAGRRGGEGGQCGHSRGVRAGRRPAAVPPPLRGRGTCQRKFAIIFSIFGEKHLKIKLTIIDCLLNMVPPSIRHILPNIANFR